MPTLIEFAVPIYNRQATDPTPVPDEGWSELQPGDILIIIGKRAASMNTDSGNSPFDAFNTPELSDLAGWTQGVAIGREFINTPPPAAPRGSAMGNFVVRPGDPLPDRGDRVTNVTKLVGKIGLAYSFGINYYYQCYTGEF